MKLLDFSEDDGLNGLRQLMRAPLITWKPRGDWPPIDIDEILKPTELVISAEDIEYAPDGTLEYNGQKLTVYIRDQEEYFQPYRFHVADCSTLKSMREGGKYDKYVIPTRTDGKFYVNTFRYDKCIEKSVMSLYVCMNCLDRLNYKRTRESFDLKEFFEIYGSKITSEPAETDITALVNDYSSDWIQIRDRYKEKVEWRCEECDIDLRERKEFLEAHHINGLKHDNREENLRALCIDCHVKQFQHQHMRHKPKHKEFLRWRNQKNSDTTGDFNSRLIF